MPFQRQASSPLGSNVDYVLPIKQLTAFALFTRILIWAAQVAVEAQGSEMESI
jgi:hypothetical protein